MNGVTFLRARVASGEKKVSDFNPFFQDWGYMYNQLMFNMTAGPFATFFEGYPKRAPAAAMVLAFFGRHLTDPNILKIFQPKPGQDPPKKSLKAKLNFISSFITMLFFLREKIQTLKRKLFEENFGDLVTPMKSVPLAEKLNCVYQEANVKMKEIMVHRFASMGSMFKTMFLMKVLKSSALDEKTADDDLNMLMSTCNDVVSAEVPTFLRNIARAILDKPKFAELSDDEALAVLQGKSGNEREAATIFASFLKWHGHRGYREMDVYNKPWERNPLPCVQVVKVNFFQFLKNLNYLHVFVFKSHFC